MSELNETRIEGKLEQSAGDIKQDVGRAVGSDSLQREGRAEEVGGIVKEEVGEAKQDVGEALRDAGDTVAS